ncbi:MAG: M48 family metalloprotease [Bacteroidetes bacterium]|nr:M48 family metalloprotease [Bacteroidota bacterium]MBU1422946.1 M48 family metalloprotease [Bacteroidota bacterium]
MPDLRFVNIYEQQRRNIRLTILIMIVFILFFTLLGYGFDFFYFGNDPLGLVGESYGFPVATFFALIFSSIFATYGLQSGAKAVLSSAGAFPVPESNPKYQTLRNVVEEMKIASGLPMPKVYIIPDHDPNAFATGKNPDNSYIAVTEGLLEKLNREELQAVVAHEMSHIKNYDIRLMTIIAALVGAIALLSDFAIRGMRFGGLSGGRKRSSRGGGSGGPIVIILFVIWIIGVILAPILSRLLAMAVSRRREYLADASGAELTRNPLALASALEKIEKAAEPTKSIKRGSAHLCIVNPLGLKVNEREGSFADLFATHPPISKRILALKSMAYQQL